MPLLGPVGVLCVLAPKIRLICRDKSASEKNFISRGRKPFRPPIWRQFFVREEDPAQVPGATPIDYETRHRRKLRITKPYQPGVSLGAEKTGFESLVRARSRVCVCNYDKYLKLKWEYFNFNDPFGTS